MSKSSPDKDIENQLESSPEIGQTAKQSIVRIFGYEISAPSDMKRPVLVLFGLVLVNVLLLLLLRQLISL